MGVYSYGTERVEEFDTYLVRMMKEKKWRFLYLMVVVPIMHLISLQVRRLQELEGQIPFQPLEYNGCYVYFLSLSNVYPDSINLDLFSLCSSS